MGIEARCEESGNNTSSYIKSTPNGVLFAGMLHIESRVHIVDVLLIQLFTQQLDCFPKPLEMNDFPFSQEFDHIVYIRVITEPQDIIIGGAGLLFCQGVTKVKVILTQFESKRLLMTENDWYFCCFFYMSI